MEIEQMRIRMGEMAAEIERLQSIIDEANAQKPVGYMVRGSFFYSKVEAEKSADYLTANYENTDVINVFVDPIPAQQSPAVAVPSPRITEQDAREIATYAVRAYIQNPNITIDTLMDGMKAGVPYSTI